MVDNYWFSADSQGRVIAKTEIHHDGTVHRFTYTVPDKIHEGHGHQKWLSVQDFIKSHPEDYDWQRKIDHPDSINRKWKGHG